MMPGTIICTGIEQVKRRSSIKLINSSKILIDILLMEKGNRSPCSSTYLVNGLDELIWKIV